jgi:two-component system response regulator AdeR
MTETDSATVLAVDDDPDVVALYEQFLGDDYDLRVAETGGAALSAVGTDVDVVMLDRRLPDVSGDDVLAHVREEGLGCRVAMVTAVDPGFDVVDMAFDDYLVKPVREREVRETVEHLLARMRYSDQLSAYYAVASKVAALEAAKGDAELAASDEFAALDRRLADLRREVTATLEELDDYATAFSEVGPNGPPSCD